MLDSVRLVLVAICCIALVGCGQWYRDMQRSAWQSTVPVGDPPRVYRVWKEGDDYSGEVLILPPDHAGDLAQIVARSVLREPHYAKPWFTAFYDHAGESHELRLRYHRETDAGLEATDMVHDRLLVFRHIPFSGNAE